MGILLSCSIMCKLFLVDRDLLILPLAVVY